MKKSFLFLALTAILLTGCDELRGIKGNGDIKTDKRNVDSFTRIEAIGNYSVEWAPGSPSLTITTDDNLLTYIKTRVQGDKLVIKSTEKRLRPTERIKIVVSGPSLSELEMTGATRFTGKGITGDKFEVSTTGASRVTLEGNVNSLVANHTGASKLYAYDLLTRKADLELTGASNAEVNVEESLSVEVSGAGKVTYIGNPRLEKQDIAGAGKIRRKN